MVARYDIANHHLNDYSALHHPRNKARAFQFNKEGSALIVIDMQRFFTDPLSHAYIARTKMIIGQVLEIINAFRKHDLPVIFTRHALMDNEDPGLMGRWWGDVLRDDSGLSKLDPDMHPEGKDLVIRKTRYSAFIATDLEQVLRSYGIKRLVITGVMTHLCCESTARDAFMRDFEVFMITDATATRNEKLQRSSEEVLADGFATLMTTKELISCLDE